MAIANRGVPVAKLVPYKDTGNKGDRISGRLAGQPTLHNYLQEGIQRDVLKRYICRNRKIWYSQENRLASNFYCTYFDRDSALNY